MLYNLHYRSIIIRRKKKGGRPRETGEMKKEERVDLA